jgi:hypothetical protein
MGKWLTQLCEIARKKTQEGSAKSAKSTFCHFWHPVMGRFLPESNRDRNNPGTSEPEDGIRDMALPGQCAELVKTIHRAITWGDLEGVLDNAQCAYESGVLLREQVEELAIEAKAMARNLPETLEDGDVDPWPFE